LDEVYASNDHATAGCFRNFDILLHCLSKVTEDLAQSGCLSCDDADGYAGLRVNQRTSGISGIYARVDLYDMRQSRFVERANPAAMACEVIVFEGKAEKGNVVADAPISWHLEGKLMSGRS